MIRLVLPLLFLFQAPTALRQATGVMTGILRTSNGSPIADVRVAVTPLGEGVADDVLESIAMTDKDGRYRLENISPGRYNVLVGRAGSRIFLPGVPLKRDASAFDVTRSFWHFVRYRIDCFYSDLKDLFERAQATASEIESHLRNI